MTGSGALSAAESYSALQRKVGLWPEPQIACHCRGPQNGQPACPCQMRDVRVMNGRYVRVIDLGPAPKGD